MKKNLILVLVMVLMAFALTSCFDDCFSSGNNQEEKPSELLEQVTEVETPTTPPTEEKDLFIVVEETDYYKVVYHAKTKVMYVIGRVRYDYTAWTVMVDENGKPLLYGE